MRGVSRNHLWIVERHETHTREIHVRTSANGGFTRSTDECSASASIVDATAKATPENVTRAGPPLGRAVRQFFTEISIEKSVCQRHVKFSAAFNARSKRKSTILPKLFKGGTIDRSQGLSDKKSRETKTAQKRQNTRKLAARCFVRATACIHR